MTIGGTYFLLNREYRRKGFIRGVGRFLSNTKGSQGLPLKEGYTS